MNGIERLLSLREENDIRGVQMLVDGERFRQLAQRHLNGTASQAITGFNLFQTPPLIATHMVELVKERVSSGRILEPSAGLGRLVDAGKDELLADWVMVEEAKECINALVKMFKRSEQNIQHRDFLTTSAEDLGGKFDAVIMNPPFKQGRDIKHIFHALDMVKDGGRLVSLCYNGTKQNQKLKEIATHWEILPEDSFKAEGTSASVALLVIDK